MGRDHTLDDVPNHYVRDFLLSYINNIRGYTEEQKEAGRKALFPDLTSGDVKDYSALLAKKMEDEEDDERMSMGIPGRNAPPEEIRKYRLKMIMMTHEVKNEKQAEAILRQQDVVRAIDGSVDLEPIETPIATRQYERWKQLTYSVLKPNELRSHDESALEPPRQIDRNCDQIRLMIRRFCCYEDPESMYDMSDNDFSLDEFHKALQIQRTQMTTFLAKKGPKEGAGTKAYHLAWEFFKKRELLGYPLKKGEDKAVRRDRDHNLSGKRRRI